MAPVSRAGGPESMHVRLLLCLFGAALLLGCASTTPLADDDFGDDDAPARPDGAPGFIDAAPPVFVDASPPADAHPGAPDAHPPGPADAAPQGTPDAAPSGPFCTQNSQCSSAAHECCWLWLPPDFTSGTCTYGDVLPIFGCVPGDPPDAGT
jgi:hypothetical protein